MPMIASRDPSRRHRPAGPALLLGALLALSVLAGLLQGCGKDEAIEPFPDAPVILISIDTLRSDRLPAYGYDGVEAPALDALAADGVVYERAWSHYPLTLPSHASVFTGLLPPDHGVRDNLGYRLDSDLHQTLAQILQADGRPTGGAVSAFVLEGGFSGLSAGFDRYDDGIELAAASNLGGVQRSGDETRGILEGWIEGHKDAPFFAFFHLYEPHTPYDPPAPFDSRYAQRPYDGEVAAADAIVGRFLDFLRAEGIYDDALIVLFSDHGEGLGDHGEQEHGILLYRESLQVPLIVKLPQGRRAGTRVAASAQLVDIFPTVLELAGLEVPEGLPGRNLLRLGKEADGGDGGDAGERPIYAETWYPRLHLGWNELTSVVEGDYHYIAGPDPELYDLAADPAETENILTRERRVLARLREALDGFAKPLEGPGRVDPEAAEKLAALGYLSAPTLASEGPLPDPKSKIPLLSELGRARQLADRGEPAQAVALLQPILVENPRMQDGWQTLALAQRRMGRFSEALDAYQRVIEMAGPQAHLLLSVADLHLQLGNLDEAQEHAEAAIDSSPAFAHLRLASVARARGDLDEAEAQVRKAVDARDQRLTPLIQLAKILARRDKLAEAREALTTVEEEMEARTSQEPPPDLYFIRGDLAMREGRPQLAERDLLKELELHPDNLDPYATLAFLYAFEGDGGRAVAMLRRMVDSNPSPAAYAAAYETLNALGDEGQARALLSYARGIYPDSEQLRALGAG